LITSFGESEAHDKLFTWFNNMPEFPDILPLIETKDNMMEHYTDMLDREDESV
jgi:hypothetical protein